MSVGDCVGRSVEVELADGRTLTFTGDEGNVAYSPISIEFDTEMPGGFGPGTVVLPRGDLSQQTLGLFSGTRIYETATDRTFHEGRVTAVSVSGGQITLQLEGWSKHLEDDKTRKYLFVDRDLSKWSGPSVQRKINVAGANVSIYDGGVATPDSNALQPAVDLSFEDKWTTASFPDVEAWYDAGPGMNIGSLYYAWKQSRALTSDVNTTWAALLCTDDVASAFDFSGNLRAVGPGSGTVSATAARRYCLLQHQCFTSPTGFTGTLDNFFCSVFFTALSVFGDHGLPKQGTGSFTDGPGLLASDCMTTVLRDAPLLSYTTGVNGSIRPTSFYITHLVQDSPGTPLDAISAINVFGGSTNQVNDWGVYDGRTFFCQPPGSYGRTWRVRRDQATESNDSGPDSAAALNGVVVFYDDGTGTQKSVGPPGAQVDVQTSALLSTDPSNPANNDGARHWAVYDAGIQNQSAATLIGQLILADAATYQWRGDVTIQDRAVDSNYTTHPVDAIRAGDFVVVEDDYDVSPRKIVGTSISGRTLTASIGADPDHLDVLLARAGVKLVGRL